MTARMLVRRTVAVGALTVAALGATAGTAHAQPVGEHYLQRLRADVRHYLWLAQNSSIAQGNASYSLAYQDYIARSQVSP
jgi:hypothetical protein